MKTVSFPDVVRCSWHCDPFDLKIAHRLGQQVEAAVTRCTVHSHACAATITGPLATSETSVQPIHGGTNQLLLESWLKI